MDNLFGLCYPCGKIKILTLESSEDQKIFFETGETFCKSCGRLMEITDELPSGNWSGKKFVYPQSPWDDFENIRWRAVYWSSFVAAIYAICWVFLGQNYHKIESGFGFVYALGILSLPFVLYSIIYGMNSLVPLFDALGMRSKTIADYVTRGVLGISYFLCATTGFFAFSAASLSWLGDSNLSVVIRVAIGMSGFCAALGAAGYSFLIFPKDH